jgi:hypothetical protein
MSQLATADPYQIDGGWDLSPGRHAFQEDAALTPIFHALARSGVPQRRHPSAPTAPVDPVDAFHQDPLTAPIPIQALVAVPSQPRRSLVSDLIQRSVASAEGGRHHLRR